MLADGFVRGKLIHQGADGLDDFKVRLLAATADAIRLADLSSRGDGEKSAHVVLYKQPVTDIAAISINWETCTIQRIDDHQGNEFFRENDKDHNCSNNW